MPGENRKISFSSHSAMNLCLNDDVRMLMAGALLADYTHLTLDTAYDAWRSLMLAPERIDYIDRIYFGLEPSHRLAFLEWRRFGLLYPFGGYNTYLNTPNPLLFGPNRKVCLQDNFCPLEGWDINAALEAGKNHGTTREDIFGCLYFYVKNQLHTFARRLRTFKINISVSGFDAINLAERLRGGSIPGISPSISFDRIEVSNIVDVEYAGVKPILDTWGPFLKEDNESAAIIGLFMNWPVRIPGASKNSMSTDETRKLMNVFLDRYQECIPTRDLLLSHGGIKTENPLLVKLLSRLDICNENSEAFHRYLIMYDGLCASSGGRNLCIRKINKIVPPVSVQFKLGLYQILKYHT
ncbi:hypothetical protein VKT23_019139 [Stygiomarasmius scandens]|uniref:Uncharacterized protein n=1 Tax=Marasmiellus scandens TaxID=2682957 RepID=A0ABR1IQ53_9AGAR